MVVCHVDKGTSNSSGGLSSHVDRRGEAQENIDKARSHLNVHLVGEGKTIDQAVNERLEKAKPHLKRAIRKDAITHSRIMISGSSERMNEMSESELLAWSADSVKFFADRYGEKNIVKAVLHRDEKTPHIHLYMTPLRKKLDSKGEPYVSLSHNKIFDKKELTQLQTDFAEQVGSKYGLSRGVKGSPRKHMTTREFYKFLEKTDRDVKDVVDELSREDLKDLVIANHRENISQQEKEKLINKNIKDGRAKATKPTGKNGRNESRSSRERGTKDPNHKRGNTGMGR